MSKEVQRIIKPEIYQSQTIKLQDYTPGWYDMELSNIFSALGGDRPFFTEIVTSDYKRTFFKDLPGFAIKVYLFSTNEELYHYLDSNNKNEVAIDTYYTGLK
jgi:hypothetical protein